MMSPKKTIFGIDSLSFYDPRTKIFLGTLNILGNGTFEMTGEQVKLKGGSSKFDWAVEQGNIESVINYVTKEYPDFLYRINLGKQPTIIPASQLGSIANMLNYHGTSLMSAVNGIDEIVAIAGKEGNLKFGTYTIVATGAKKIKIYVDTGVDLGRGEAVEYLSDDLAITEELTLIDADDNDTGILEKLGINIKTIGVSAFTVGDTMTFDIFPPHDGGMEVVIGGLNDTFPAVGVVIVTQKQANGQIFMIDCPNCSASGLNLGGAEKAFTETPVTMSVAYSSRIRGIARIKRVDSLIG